MRNQPLIKSKIIEIDSHELFIVELREGYDHAYKYYWIHGNNIDVIYCNNNSKMVGKGLRNNEELIEKAVEVFKLDGHNLDKIVLLPPHGEPIYQPAVMYDSSDYYIISIDELTKLEHKLRLDNYIHTKYIVNEVPIRKEDICIVQLPLDQEVINEIWNWRDKALKKFLEQQFNKLLE